MKLYRRTWAEVDLDRLGENYRNYRSLLPEGIEVMCVVKAFCYGHGDAVCPKYLNTYMGRLVLLCSKWKCPRRPSLKQPRQKKQLQKKQLQKQL